MEPISKDKRKYVVINQYKGDIYVHIRTHRINNSGDYFATKWGLALTREQFLALEYHSAAMTEAAEEKAMDVKYHLGSSKFICFNGKIDLRRWFVDNIKGITPGHYGISLTKTEWKKLCKLIPNIKKHLPHIDKVGLCCFGKSREEVMNCINCTPYVR